MYDSTITPNQRQANYKSQRKPNMTKPAEQTTQEPIGEVDPSKLYTVRALARAIGKKPCTINSYRRTKGLDAVVVGDSTFIYGADFIAWARRGCTKLAAACSK
jgi:hypothetical protein